MRRRAAAAANRRCRRYTHDAAGKLQVWLDALDVKAAQKFAFQLRCEEESTGRVRVIVVTGSMPMFALNRFVAEAFGWGVGDVDYRPLSGKAPAKSLFLCAPAHVDDARAMISSKTSATAAAGKGAHSSIFGCFFLLLCLGRRARAPGCAVHPSALSLRRRHLNLGREHCLLTCPRAVMVLAVLSTR